MGHTLDLHKKNQNNNTIERKMEQQPSDTPRPNQRLQRRRVRSVKPHAQIQVETMIEHHKRRIAQAATSVDNRLPYGWRNRQKRTSHQQTQARGIEINTNNIKMVRELTRIQTRQLPVDIHSHTTALQQLQERAAKKKLLLQRQLIEENKRLELQLVEALKHRPACGREVTQKPKNHTPSSPRDMFSPKLAAKNCKRQQQQEFSINERKQPTSSLHTRRTLANLLESLSPPSQQTHDGNDQTERAGETSGHTATTTLPDKAITRNIHTNRHIRDSNKYCSQPANKQSRLRTPMTPSTNKNARRPKHSHQHRHIIKGRVKQSKRSATTGDTPNTHVHTIHSGTPSTHTLRKCSLVAVPHSDSSKSSDSCTFEGTVEVPIIDFMPRSVDGALERVTWRHDLVPNAQENDDVPVVIGSYLCQVSIKFSSDVTSTSTSASTGRTGEHTIVLQATRLDSTRNNNYTSTTMEKYTSIEAQDKDLKELFDITDLNIDTASLPAIAHLTAKFLWLHATGNRINDGSNSAAQRGQNRAVRFSPKLMLFPRNHLTSVANDVKRRRGSQVLENGLIFALAQDIDDKDVTDLESAAVRLQATVRGHKQRRMQKQIEWAALRLQTVFRGHRGRNAFKKAQNIFFKEEATRKACEMQAARHLQAVFRGHHQRVATNCVDTRQIQMDGMDLKVTLSVRGVHLFVEATGQGEHETLLLPNNKISEITGQPTDLASCSAEEAKKIALKVYASLKWRYGFLQKLGHLYSSHTRALGEKWVPFRRSSGRETHKGERVLLSIHQVTSKRMMAGQEDAIVLAVQLHDVKRLESIWFEVSTHMQLAQLRGYVEVPPAVLMDVQALL